MSRTQASRPPQRNTLRTGDRLTADGSRIGVGHVRRPRPPYPTW